MISGTEERERTGQKPFTAQKQRCAYWCPASASLLLGMGPSPWNDAAYIPPTPVNLI